MIKLHNITKKFGDNEVFSNLSIEFSDGATYGIIGRNGSGKTLLFKMICGLVPMSSGEIDIDGRRLWHDIDVPPDMGVLIESPGFFSQFDGLTNLLLLSSIKKKVNKDAIINCMEQVGLVPNNKKAVRTYSMGMKQRLGIAQAIMESPKLLILDEPFNNLDEKGVTEIRQLISFQKRVDTTVLLSSHNMDDINAICDNVYKISDGTLISVYEHNK